MWKTAGIAEEPSQQEHSSQARRCRLPEPLTTTTTGCRTSGVRVITAEENFVDNPPKREESVGDTFVFSANLRRDGHLVGRAGVTCTLTAVKGPGDIFCTGAAAFAHGQITVAGLVEGEDEEDGWFDVAITGGTGRFKDADGTMTVIDETERLEFWHFNFTD